MLKSTSVARTTSGQNEHCLYSIGHGWIQIPAHATSPCRGQYRVRAYSYMRTIFDLDTSASRYITDTTGSVPDTSAAPPSAAAPTRHHTAPNVTSNVDK